MIKRIHLFILVIATLFCGCKDSNSLDSTTKVFLSIPARVLEEVNGEEISVCAQVLKNSKVIIDEKHDKELFFDENNKPYIDSVVLEDIPLYTRLVLKMQIFVGEELFAEGQSDKTLFTEGKNTLNLQLKLIPQKTEPENPEQPDDENKDSTDTEEPKEPSEEEPKEPSEEEPEEPTEPELELKINQTSIAVEEWEENATFTATEGFDSYNWTCGDQTGTTKEFVVDISKLNVAEYEVKLVAKKGETECYATSKLTVNAISTPLVITEKDDSTENRYSFILFEANDGFSNYEWKFGEQTGSGNSFTINLSSLNPGEHQVILTATKGTKQYTVTKKFVINSKIIIGEFTQSEVEISLSSRKYMEGYEKLFFTASEGFDSYTWKYANKNVSGNSIELDTSTLPLGKYVLQLLAVKNGIEYSAQVEFEIQNKISSNLVLIKDLVINIDGDTGYSTTLSVPEGYDSYKWRCQNLTSDENTFTINWGDLIIQDVSSPYILVNVIAVKNGVEYSAEITFSILL